MNGKSISVHCGAAAAEGSRGGTGRGRPRHPGVGDGQEGDGVGGLSQGGGLRLEQECTVAGRKRAKDEQMPTDRKRSL